MGYLVVASHEPVKTVLDFESNSENLFQLIVNLFSRELVYNVHVFLISVSAENRNYIFPDIKNTEHAYQDKGARSENITQEIALVKYVCHYPCNSLGNKNGFDL